MADLSRRAQVSQAANDRFAAAQAAVLSEDATPLKELGAGMRNQDLRPALDGETPTDPKQRRRQASAVSRKLALLRAHGILEKVSKSHRYRLTEKGKQGLPALLAAANAPTSKLTNLAVLKMRAVQRQSDG